MHILTKQALRFRNGAETFLAMGGGNIQSAPDWVGQTALFKAALQKQMLFVMDQKPVLAKPAAFVPEPVAVVPPQVIEVEETPQPAPGFNLAQFNEKTIAAAKDEIEAGKVDPHLGIIADQAAKAGVRSAAMARLKVLEG